MSMILDLANVDPRTLIGKGKVGLLDSTGTYDVDRYALGLRVLEAPAADPLDGRGGAARRRPQGLGVGPRHAQRARAADADFPVLHPVGHRGRRQLPQALHPDLPAAGGADDDGRLHQHGDGAHRRLCAAAQDPRHAEDRVRGVPRLCRDARQGRLHARNSASRRSPTSRARWRCSARSPRACRCLRASRCCSTSRATTR